MRRTDRALRPSPFVMAVHDGADTRAAARLQVWRRRTQTGFFLLFLLAPALNLLRFDLADRQLWFLGLRWSLGLDALVRGELSATQAALSILWRAFIPGIMLVAAFLAVAYRFGRLYCGWLCPHFSVVEGLNKLLHRACGKFSLWDMSVTLRAGPPQRRWWPLFALSCGCMGFVWAITLLSYLVTPATVWGGLFSGTLSGNPARFLLVGTLLVSCEFAFARHLFCRFGCAVGLFQSLAWMANPRGMVVAFERAIAGVVAARPVRSARVAAPVTVSVPCACIRATSSA